MSNPHMDSGPPPAGGSGDHDARSNPSPLAPLVRAPSSSPDVHGATRSEIELPANGHGSGAGREAPKLRPDSPDTVTGSTAANTRPVTPGLPEFATFTTPLLSAPDGMKSLPLSAAGGASPGSDLLLSSAVSKTSLSTTSAYAAPAPTMPNPSSVAASVSTGAPSATGTSAPGANSQQKPNGGAPPPQEDKEDAMIMNMNPQRRAAAGSPEMMAGLPNLLEEEDEKESSLAKLQRYIEERRAELEKRPVSTRHLGETSWWDLITSSIFGGFAVLNLALNVRIYVSIASLNGRRPNEINEEIWKNIEVFNQILLWGMVKDAARAVIFLVLMILNRFDGALEMSMLKWGYAYLAHSPVLIPMLLSSSHRRKIIPSLKLVNHPKIVFWDIVFGDLPSAVICILQNVQNFSTEPGKTINFEPILIVTAVIFGLLVRLTRFLWIALLMMNEFGQKRARALRLLKHLYLWGRGLEYYIVFLGDDTDKQKLIQHIKSRVQDFQEMKAKHIQDAWAKGFKSIIILNTLQSVVSLLSGIYRFQLDKANDVSTHLPDFERVVKEYEQELINLRGKALWKLSVKDRHIEVIKLLWKNELVRTSLRKFQTTHADKWQERRFSRILGVKDILDDPHQITSLLSSSLTVDQYCLEHAERILSDEYEPTVADLEQMPISLTELLFTELCKSTSYHVKDKVLANNICILDVPKGFSRTKLQALIPFCQTLILFLDMNKFDEMVMLAKPKAKPAASGGGGNTNVGTNSGHLNVLGGDRFGQQTIGMETVDASPKDNDAFASAAMLPGPGEAGAASPTGGAGGGPTGVLKPRLQVELEFFERVCNAKDKNNMVTGILVFWKNYSVFKARVNAPGGLDNFIQLYPDYNEKSHGALNGPNVIRYFKRRILRAANPGDRYVSIIPDWELNRRFDLFATLNEVIFDHYVVHRVT